MAKKTENNPKINCTCGKEWNIQTVLNDQTIHTINTYSFKFLGIYSIDYSGFVKIEKLTACPNCRKELRNV